MRILAPEDVPHGELGSAVTIGAYDGVHIGHRRLLRLLQGKAGELGVPTVVVTFDRHPATVIRPASAPLILTDVDQKLELLAACGVDVTVVVRFDEERSKESAEDFVDEVLCGALGAKLVVVGEDFHFGHGRKGNVALLRELGAKQGFDVVGVSLTEASDAAGGATAGGATGGGATGGGATAGGQPAAEGRAVSSTRIRALIGEGDVAAAARLLARPHEVRGEVVHGDGRGGSQLGMPTANLSVPSDIAIPALGIYAGWFRRADGTLHPAAISVGVRPTFAVPEGTPVLPLVEAHLIDFDGDLYGERVGVSFVERLREERRFDGIDELIEQMWADVAIARRVLLGAEG